MDAIVEIIQPITQVVEIFEPSTTVVEVAPVVGPQGPQGVSGDALAFEHVQSTPAATWIIDVPAAFGRRPAVSIYLGNELVDTDIVASSTTVSVIFPAPASGSAVLT